MRNNPDLLPERIHHVAAFHHRDLLKGQEHREDGREEMHHRKSKHRPAQGLMVSHEFIERFAKKAFEPARARGDNDALGHQVQETTPVMTNTWCSVSREFQAKGKT